MKSLTLSPTFQKKIQRISKRNATLFTKIIRTLEFFQKNPKHPSLRLHKLQGNLRCVWSISVTSSFRLIFIEDASYYFFDCGEHKEIYKDPS